MTRSEELLSIKEAAEISGKTQNNIQYLIQYGRINRYDNEGELAKNSGEISKIKISRRELEEYLEKRRRWIESRRKVEIGEYDERLAFDELTEKERTKHVHRLHPYKGKFIPQLVEFFLDKYFEKEQIILDPFVGSGTCLVQANEMGMNSIGIDISPFNCLISKVKTESYDLKKLEKEVNNALRKVESFSTTCFEGARGGVQEVELKELISEFNNGKMRKLREKFDTHDELKKHSEEKFYEWIRRQDADDLLEEKKEVKLSQESLSKFKLSDFEVNSEYLNKWFVDRSLKELLYFRSIIPKYEYEDVLKVILSRAARSARIVPHYDLASPDEPVKRPYYCYKHYKICAPIQKAIGKLRHYSKDTIRRIKEFSNLRNENCFVKVIQDDSRTINLENYFEKSFFDDNKIDGIFTSPPYVGNIDYHEQHRYAYELLGGIDEDMERHDEKEIGPKFKGKGKKARKEYQKGISKSLMNLRRYISRNSLIFFVANDKYDLYPKIVEDSEMEIIREYKRPVSKRAERDRRPYSEKIFEMVYI